ncbi:uncharacterized protein LOC124454752 [Xenia sp. Carnegie-2017]|uniref:uncharacterized protein LOC124454752 n=1 Tax=Xenia sp. Carnegie-2017 TaxID=2897299 RepID=UPI001F04C856|nr:uncharacterized protein LOC124454752 [Xenia sp. Carnegie-2017]XP_046861471.1 uncharacterized protein LOC124454752 [Xenia sp. Carnegie-2017]
MQPGRNSETSTGKAHYFEEPVAFPTTRFKRSLLAPLPPTVAKGLVQPSVYETTTGSTHNIKVQESTLHNPLYKKAPNSMNVNYVEDILSTLKVKPWRTPLTMGYQSSEMKHKYKGEPEVTLETKFDRRFQPSVLHDHHLNGPCKSLVRSTQNMDVSGHVFDPKDRGILSYHGDMYLTTTQHDHRAFNEEELNGYPKKNYATIWECEEYPKAWGHGSKENPLPRHSVPRDDRPMRDVTVFPSATTIPPFPQPLKHVPSSMTTEIRSNFLDPRDRKKNELLGSSLPKPLHRREAGKEEIYIVPKMYETEYQYIGQKRPAMIA